VIAKKLKSLVKAGRADWQEFESFKGSQLVSWIKEQVQKAGAKISAAAIDRLIVLVGNDLWQLESEIKKLVNYCHGKEITENDIGELVIGKFNDNIFQFVDAISQKNKARSAQLLSEQLNSGANQFYLLSMLVRQFRNILLIKDLKESHAVSSSAQAAQKLKMHPFVAQKTWSQADRFQQDELKNIYQRLLAIEKRFKSSSWSAQLLFDLFVVGL